MLSLIVEYTYTRQQEKVKSECVVEVKVLCDQMKRESNYEPRVKLISAKTKEAKLAQDEDN